MLDLRRLAVLHQFSVSGSITATAEALGYSASAISQQLTALERETGAVLLERTARSATLTDAGRLLARHARTLLADSEAAEADLAALLDRISGFLHVTTIPSLAAPVASALATLQREHPDLEIVMRQTSTDQAAANVADHLSDIAVADDWSMRAWRPPEGLKKRKVFTEAVVLAVPADHPLAALRRPLSAKEFSTAVAEMTWLCTPVGQGSRVAGRRAARGGLGDPAPAVGVRGAADDRRARGRRHRMRVAAGDGRDDPATRPVAQPAPDPEHEPARAPADPREHRDQPDDRRQRRCDHGPPAGRRGARRVRCLMP